MDIEGAVRLAEILVSKVQANESNTARMLNNAIHVLETLQLFREATSSKYGEERLHLVVRSLDKERGPITKMDSITLKLRDCVDMCDKLGGRRRNVFVAMFGKSVLTKHLERVCDLVREMQLKSLVAKAQSSDSPLQIFQQMYIEDEIVIDDSYIKGGGTADILRGTWLVHGKPNIQVAVKIFRTLHSKDHGKLFHKRLSRECRAWAKLDHEYILKFFGICLMNKGNGRLELGIVTPFCKLGASDVYFAVHGDLSKRLRLDFLRKSADAIAYLHEKGIVHGDVKPSNILVKDDGTPAICDFGNSRIVESQNDTETCRPAGTPRYMPPEAVNDTLNSKLASDCKPLTFAGDVWSFAMTALELMSGHVPYYAFPSDIAILLNILHGPLPARGYYDGVPQGVWNILVRCWIRDPNSRPTMPAVKTDMDVPGIEDDLGSPSMPESSPEGQLTPESDLAPPPALRPTRAQ